MYLKYIFFIAIISLSAQQGWSQTDDDATEVPLPDYNLTGDDPYELYKLFIHVQPFYADLAAMNITGGIGVEVDYFHEDLFDLTFSARTSYGKRFDINRMAASTNGPNTNKPTPYYYVELGGTYHIIDEEKSATSKVTLYDGSLKGNAWSATVPGNVEVENQVRHIVGARIGGSYSASTTDLSRALEAQDKSLFYSDGSPVVSDDLYTNIYSATLNFGASMSWFRNFAVEFDAPYSPSGEDLLLTTYLDVLYAPYLQVDDLVIEGQDVSAKNVNTSAIGFRAGVTGKFNRKLGWGYGLETGLRPGLQNRGFFLTAKMSFPVFGIKLNQGSDSSSVTD
jgi:hypothetical protein